MRATRDAWVLLAVPLGVLFVFTLVPTLLAFGLSFFRWSGGEPADFVGLENYRLLFAEARFGAAVRNTLVFTLVSVPLTVLGAFLLAVTLRAEWFRGRGAVQAMLFIPTVVSTAAVGFIWRWVLSDSSGLLNFGLAGAGVDHPPRWLSEDPWPLIWIMVIGVWRQVGFCVLIYLSALAGQDRALVEAASLDGATRGRAVRHVLWPGVRGTTAFLLLTQALAALQVFDLVFVLTAGQETGGTSVLGIEVYRRFASGLMGPAAAAGVVALVLALPLGAWHVRRTGGRA